MNTQRIARPLAALAAAVLTAGLYGCGQQQVSPDVAAATPLAPHATRLTVPSGTEVHMTLSSPIDSATSHVGDAIDGTTTSAILVGNQVAIPAGSTIQGRVTGVDPATKGLKISEKGGSVVLSFTKVTTPYGDSATMSGSLTNLAGSGRKTAGIIEGSVAGGTKGTEVKIPAGTGLAITLDQPMTITQRS